MTDVSITPVACDDGETCVGSGSVAAPGATGLLAFAAAPTFAAMALWNGLSAGQPDMLCIGMQDGSPLGGMTLMYLLMSAFHLAPWLRLLSSRRSGARRT
jgi:hypothetical protein